MKCNSILLTAFFALVAQSHASLKPRGVPQQKLSLYRPDQPFTCFDKSKSYPFEHVNDDYCDCPDGSDEPGTSACPNGKFFCANVGFRPKYISSMFVDDGVCDCCDGSDEQPVEGGHSPCPNRCESLGRIALQAAEEKRATMELGHQAYKSYVQKYQDDIVEKREKLKGIEAERSAAEVEKQRLQTDKEEVEKVESEAKEKHQKEWEEVKKQLLEERKRKRIADVFAELDVNQDGRVTFDELKTHLEFDVNGDGEVSDEEAREHLEDPVDGAADLEHFTEKVWDHISSTYRMPGSESPTTTDEHLESTTTESPYPDEEEEEDDEEDEARRLADERLREFERHPHHDHHYFGKSKQEEDDADLKMPEYPEETKQLMAQADQAREVFENARKAYEDLDREYADLLAVTATDFGNEGEFYALRGECFEVDDREYTYRLCPFERAVQKQKHGHQEVGLGRFEGWRASGENKYGVQMYSQGETCWNGPARSTTAKIICGSENKILAVSEPNRCEYAMDFATPAACREPPPPIEHHSFWADPSDHNEL